jgi:transketolase
MRNAFIEELINAAELNEKICLIVGDLGYGVVEPFAKRFPNRFFNAGVAEQNMMGLSAGIASEGFHVFVYSIANFPTFRCAEQIRNDVDYHNLPVTIVAVGGGLAYGKLGYSHHAIQDYALLRVMPNILIASPGDPLETKACMKYLIDNPQPSYLRLGKAGEPNVHNEIPTISPGEWVNINVADQNAVTFLTTGSTLNFANQLLQKKMSKKEYTLKSLPLWGMKHKYLQDKLVEKCTKIITIEDHLKDGGFGSWLLESVSHKTDLLSKINIHGLDSSICGLVGDQETLNYEGGLNDLMFQKYFNGELK